VTTDHSSGEASRLTQVFPQAHLGVALYATLTYLLRLPIHA